MTDSMPPQRVDVHDGERTVTLFGHNHSPRLAIIVDQIVRWRVNLFLH